jgi:hypothetical protein
MRGTAFRFGSKVIPWGNIEHYLEKKQVPLLYQSLNSSNVNLSCVNFVLDPQHCHPDPISSILQDSCVEGHLDKIFKLETIGLSEDDALASSDLEKVDEFRRNIEFKFGKYHVALPWNDKISQVNDNFDIARAVLNRVVARLKAQGNLESYGEVFEQQLRDGILEEVPWAEVDRKGMVFIPHRAVIKSSPSCTTKVRPVLNCSLRSGGRPSLNDAAFPGVDLMGDLFALLIELRYDDYLLMSDIKQAFLQIRLSSESDKNKFCILW